MIGVATVDFLARSLDHDRRTELPVIVKTPDVIVLVIGPVEVVTN
jgi:hypothetical protein